jgi:hypothetical protein
MTPQRPPRLGMDIRFVHATGTFKYHKRLARLATDARCVQPAQIAGD